jgi:hypothetical protein
MAEGWSVEGGKLFAAVPNKASAYTLWLAAACLLTPKSLRAV